MSDLGYAIDPVTKITPRKGGASSKVPQRRTPADSILNPQVVEHKDRGIRALAVIKPRALTNEEAAELAEQFPETDPGFLPLGQNILVQIQKPQKKSKGGVLLADETQDHMEWNEMVGRVIALGPLAYRNPNTGEKFAEGDWCVPGDFIRVPKYGGDRNRGDEALFVVFKDRDVISLITGNPLTFRNRI